MQARVRRKIVVRLIEEAVARGHPAYSNVRMEGVMQRALELLEDGVLEELVALARQSQSDMENLQAAKHGTPPLGEREKARAFEGVRPSAVTSEMPTRRYVQGRWMAEHGRMWLQLFGEKRCTYSLAVRWWISSPATSFARLGNRGCEEEGWALSVL